MRLRSSLQSEPSHGSTTGFDRRRTTLVCFALMAALSTGAACSRSQPPSEAGSTPPKSTDEAYTPPPEGTSSLVQSLTARRDRNGVVKVTGRMLLPATTRIWVEIYPAKTGPQEQLLGRSELYLDPDGSFEAGPFNLSGAGPYRVLVTCYFSRSWQHPEVLRAVGLKGTKLPKSALKLDNPQTPSNGGHIEYSGALTVGST